MVQGFWLILVEIEITNPVLGHSVLPDRETYHWGVLIAFWSLISDVCRLIGSDVSVARLA